MNFRASVLRPRSFILAGWEGGDLAASPRLGAQLSAGSSGSGAKTLEHQTDFNDSRLHEKERMVMYGDLNHLLTPIHTCPHTAAHRVNAFCRGVLPPGVHSAALQVVCGEFVAAKY
ncbi:hypothetical protein FQA47_021862 [Oryzias melastigma]|uniref:Uncharacterized protein n=1 Tax=Oryzias melastigma TaxID=30732 RepID=A0A834C2N1_ORYME|nr:hypothetical protein FQA47_021862 [Oryzias melastigma]